eukprot:GGOE01008768.1.p3 GENE.GGOE01008768.1~~GGOE01008768.1.p3  ORF type:complete len:128 (-),score=1.52 GGOE01008768.1:331-714(-)
MGQIGIFTAHANRLTKLVVVGNAAWMEAKLKAAMEIFFTGSGGPSNWSQVLTMAQCVQGRHPKHLDPKSIPHPYILQLIDGLEIVLREGPCPSKQRHHYKTRIAQYGQNVSAPREIIPLARHRGGRT